MPIESIVIPDELFLHARNGDSDALSALWDRCAPIVGHALRRYHPPADSPLDRSDVAQEAACFFLETLHRDDCPNGAALVQRLFHQLPSHLSSYLRAERRRLGRQILADEPELEKALQRGRVTARPSGPPGRRIARALQRLSPRQRAVIAGIYFAERSRESIAEELGIRANTVSQFHQRALTTLREILSAPEPSDDSEVDDPPTDPENAREDVEPDER